MFIHAGSHPKNVKPTYTNISTPNITLVPKLNLINVKVVKNKINIDKVTLPKSLLKPMFFNKLSIHLKNHLVVVLYNHSLDLWDQKMLVWVLVNIGFVLMFGCLYNRYSMRPFHLLLNYLFLKQLS